jgi:hypothetical protein
MHATKNLISERFFVIYVLPVRPLENLSRMTNCTGSDLRCEYTVSQNGKKEKNGKMGVEKWSFSAKSVKNGPKLQKVPPCFPAKLACP